MPNARMEAVNVLGQRVMKLTLAPDWKWSNDIKPIVGTASCKQRMLGSSLRVQSIASATMVPKQPTLRVTLTPSHLITTLGVSAEIKPLFRVCRDVGRIKMSLYRKIKAAQDVKDIEWYLGLFA